MKKSIIFIALLAIVQHSFAQNMDYRNTVSLSSGRSLFVSLRGVEAKPSADLTFTGGKASATPTIQGSYDFAVTNWFSVGLAAAYNNTKIDFTNISYKGKVSGDVNATVARTSLAARFLFHYANKGRWDLYSGARIGAGIWTAKLNADVNDELLTDLLGSFESWTPGFITNRLNGKNVRGGFVLLQAQLIPIGARYYITENIGAHAEIAVGAPYYATIGANYRF